MRRARLDERVRRASSITRTSRSPADGGTFELTNVPPGTYTIEAWHEKLGTQTQQVTLGEKDSKELSFTFKAARATERPVTLAPPLRRRSWPACTVLLLAAGGMVTSTDSGLAVPDWPNTYGHFMFSFPLEKMVGGIFYEHGHRMIASIVGMLTIVLAVWTWRVDPRRGSGGWRSARSAPSSSRACSAA